MTEAAHFGFAVQILFISMYLYPSSESICFCIIYTAVASGHRSVANIYLEYDQYFTVLTTANHSGAYKETNKITSTRVIIAPIMMLSASAIPNLHPRQPPNLSHYTAQRFNEHFTELKYDFADLKQVINKDNQIFQKFADADVQQRKYYDYEASHMSTWYQSRYSSQFSYLDRDLSGHRTPKALGAP